MRSFKNMSLIAFTLFSSLSPFCEFPIPFINLTGWPRFKVASRSNDVGREARKKWKKGKEKKRECEERRRKGRPAGFCRRSSKCRFMRVNEERERRVLSLSLSLYLFLSVSLSFFLSLSFLGLGWKGHFCFILFPSLASPPLPSCSRLVHLRKKELVF